MGVGRISLNVDSPLRTMLVAARQTPAEVQKRIAQETKSEAQPIWFEELRDGASTKLQQRVLVDSGRVGATQRNVFLRSGSAGTLRSGTAIADIAKAAEFGMYADKEITTRSRKGKEYTRRGGSAFLGFRRGGYVFWPAVARSIGRFASLWIQTGVRTLLDNLQGKK